jgi:hypothetical protein
VKIIKVKGCLACPYLENTEGSFYCEGVNRLIKRFDSIPEDCPLSDYGDKTFDFKNIEVKTVMDGREDFLGDKFIPYVKFQSDKFAVIEVPTVLKNGHISTFSGNVFTLVADENSRLWGKPVTGKDYAWIELSLPEGWRIYDANPISSHTIAVYVEKSSSLDKLEGN